MANYCSTDIRIECVSEEQAQNLYHHIVDWMETEYPEYPNSRKWLGRIVLGSGVGTVGAGVDTDLRCRGTVEMYYADGCTVRIATETAYAPMLKVWSLVIYKFAPGAKLFYYAVEPGWDIFATNVEDWHKKYYIDVVNGDTEYELDEEDAIAFMRSKIGTSATDIKELINAFEDEGKGWVHQWDFVPVEEWG